MKLRLADRHLREDYVVETESQFIPIRDIGGFWQALPGALQGLSGIAGAVFGTGGSVNTQPQQLDPMVSMLLNQQQMAAEAERRQARTMNTLLIGGVLLVVVGGIVMLAQRKKTTRRR